MHKYMNYTFDFTPLIIDHNLLMHKYMNYEVSAPFWGCMKYEYSVFLNPIYIYIYIYIYLLYQHPPFYILYQLIEDVWGVIYPSFYLFKKLLVSP